MPAVATELQLSRRIVANKSAEFLYLVTGTDDEQTALAAVEAEAAATYTFANGSGIAGDDVTLPRQPVELDPILIDGTRSMWEARVRYEPNSSSSQSPPQENDNVYSFDTTGGTEKITQSKETIASYAPSGLTARSCKGAIGVDGKAVNGCEITVPVFRWEEKVWLAPSTVTNAYRITCHNLTGKTNASTFRGFPAGDVLFLGVRGSRTGTASDDLWEVTFIFAASPNATNITVGDITVAAKKGWEYLWVLYEDAADTDMLVKVPRAAYVERVYDSGDFSSLGIGTGTL